MKNSKFNLVMGVIAIIFAMLLITVILYPLRSDLFGTQLEQIKVLVVAIIIPLMGIGANIIYNSWMKDKVLNNPCFNGCVIPVQAKDAKWEHLKTVKGESDNDRLLYECSTDGCGKVYERLEYTNTIESKYKTITQNIVEFNLLGKHEAEGLLNPKPKVEEKPKSSKTEKKESINDSYLRFPTIDDFPSVGSGKKKYLDIKTNKVYSYTGDESNPYEEVSEK